ncbi:MAG TPA: DUF2207 domain-containing protein [Thermomicrobiales bacterium]|nr:DUF2207 domain-containing protein [Thermomicrobiales bacterium]
MDTATAILHLLFLAGMLLIIVGGLLAILLLWYSRGRDPHIGPVAEYLSEPPDDLPPGAVGTLIDEHADEHDVMATLLGLARHGAVEITQVSENGRRDFVLMLIHPRRIEDRIERDLLVVLFGPDPQALQEVRLSDVRGVFLAHRDRIRRDLYREIVDRGYFTRSPEVTRKLWRWIAWSGVAISVVFGIALTILTDAWALLPAIAGVIVSLVLVRVARRMPQKTRKGAEAAARWRAFRTYLQDIRKYESVETATELFDRYLAYAVAFEIEKQWVKTFERAGTPAPRWYHSAGDILVLGEAGELLGEIGHLGRVPGPGDIGDVNLPDVGGIPNIGLPDVGGVPNVDLPGAGDALQGASDLVSGGLQGASDGIFDLFDAAGSIFDGLDFDI